MSVKCGIIDPRQQQNPFSRAEARRIAREEIRERELEKKWKAGNITKMEAAELMAAKVLRILDSDTFVKS